MPETGRLRAIPGRGARGPLRHEMPAVDEAGLTAARQVDRVNGSASLGIVIGDPADTNQGYGSDALRAMLAFGFGELRLERIWLDVYAYKDRARRVYERLGFVHEGTLRHGLFRAGAFHDVHRMAILRAEWEEARSSAG